jgi:hypothetical protein
VGGAAATAVSRSAWRSAAIVAFSASVGIVPSACLDKSLAVWAALLWSFVAYVEAEKRAAATIKVNFICFKYLFYKIWSLLLSF